MPAVRAWPSLQASLQLLRARPWVTLALGAAVLLSLLSACCGIGLFTTPWFLCELLALQLSELRSAPVRRTVGWIAAGFFLSGAVILVGSVTLLTLLGATPEQQGVVGQPPGMFVLLQSSGALAAAAGGVAALFVLPLLYCPLLLIERPLRFEDALLESASLVAEGGVLAHVRLSLIAHALQIAPPVLAAMVTALFDPGAVPMAALCALPLLCATLPLGQGMIVSAYATGPVEAWPTAAPNSEASGVRAAFRVTGRQARSFVLIMLLPLGSVLALGGTLLLPSRLASGKADHGVLVAELVPSKDRPVGVVIADTALTLLAEPYAVRVVASDGGGVGALPLRSARPITAVRVRRVGDLYAIEIEQAGGSVLCTLVDRAGVRQDDDLRARLFDRVTPAGLAFVLGVLLAAALLALPVLDGLARARRCMALPAGREPSAQQRALQLQRSVRRARRASVLLLVLSLAASYVALTALSIL